MEKTAILKLICFTAMAVFVISCGGSSDSGSDSSSDSGSPVQKTVTISWTANKESGVNTTDGGYKIYYSETSGFDISSADSVDVPYVSGASAPTTTDIELSEGTYYIKIVAYSAINSEGSEPSDETSVTVTE